MWGNCRLSNMWLILMCTLWLSYCMCCMTELCSSQLTLLTIDCTSFSDGLLKWSLGLPNSVVQTLKCPYMFLFWIRNVELQAKYSSSKAPPPAKDEEDGLDEEFDEEHGDTLCGACGENYASDEFWICCDICERWFHGKCVKITPARAEHIKQYKCPSCSNKRARPWNFHVKPMINITSIVLHFIVAFVGILLIV